MSPAMLPASSNASLLALPLCPPCPASARSRFLHPRGLPPRRGARLLLVSAVQKKSPKGFGKEKKAPQQQLKKTSPEETAPKRDGSSVRTALEEEDEQPEDDVVPEVVTNRMLKRITYTVGVPFAVGIAFFGLYYYLKAVKKVDIPEWLPLFTSLLTFGSSGAGITYGVLSASWDPKREGSVLGWKEAQLNWPVFWETFRGKQDKAKSR